MLMTVAYEQSVLFPFWCVKYCLYINKLSLYIGVDFFRIQTESETDLVWNALIWDITEARAVQHNQKGVIVPLQIF